MALFAAVTLLIRRPFTLAYAKDSTPPDIWDSPAFLRVNNVITAVWAGAFFFSAAVGCFGDAVLRDANNFWTGWILHLAATFLAISFTDFYPNYVQAKAPKETEDSATSPPTSIARLFDWVPTFVLIAGIVGLVTDSLSSAVGYTLIAIGAIGAAGVRKFFPRRAEIPRSSVNLTTNLASERREIHTRGNWADVRRRNARECPP